MYRQNMHVQYKSNRGEWDETVTDLEKQDIFVNQHQHVNINFPNVFVKMLTPYFDSHSEGFMRWGYGDYMTFWQSQLIFAVHCSTTVLGISAQMLNDHSISPMVRSILRFHAYYHVRRILSRLQVPLPYEDKWDAATNSYSKGAFAEICAEYGADPKGPYKFRAMRKAYNNPGHRFFQIEDRDYAQWIIPTSEGLTSKALTKLSESIRLYARLILGAQSAGKASIIGNNADNLSVRQLYLQGFEKIVKRSEDLQADLVAFQNLLKYARTPVNFVVIPQTYMIPADLNLRIGQIQDYNNNIFIAPKSARVGEVQNLNLQLISHPADEKQQQISHPAKAHEKQQPLPHPARVFAKAHEDEKQALVIGLTVVILGIIYFKN